MPHVIRRDRERDKEREKETKIYKQVFISLELIGCGTLGESVRKRSLTDLLPQKLFDHTKSGTISRYAITPKIDISIFSFKFEK